jgi:hypothetical protein
MWTILIEEILGILDYKWEQNKLGFQVFRIGEEMIVN